jgi:hypothetical protein
MSLIGLAWQTPSADAPPAHAIMAPVSPSRFRRGNVAWQATQFVIAIPSCCRHSCAPAPAPMVSARTSKPLRAPPPSCFHCGGSLVPSVGGNAGLPGVARQTPRRHRLAGLGTVARPEPRGDRLDADHEKAHLVQVVVSGVTVTTVPTGRCRPGATSCVRHTPSPNPKTEKTAAARRMRRRFMIRPRIIKRWVARRLAARRNTPLPVL